MLFAMRVTYVMPCALPIQGNQPSQPPKSYKNQKLGNKIGGDTEDSTVQCSRLKRQGNQFDK